MIKEELYKQAEYYDIWADVDTGKRTWNDVRDDFHDWPTRNGIDELVSDFIDDWANESDHDGMMWMDNVTNTFLRLLIIEAMDD